MIENYESLNRLNWSRLKLIEKSPAHFRYGRGEDSGGFALGTAVHMAILEPERFATHYEVWAGGRRYGKTWDAFESAALERGHEVLSKKEHDEAIAIRNSVLSHPKARAYLTGGKAEVPMIWELGRFECKGRVDYIGPAAIVDLKSTQDAHPRAFSAACARYGYFGQASWYGDGHKLSTGKRLPFVFIAVEKSPPYVVQVFRVPDAVLEAGREQYLSLLGRLDYCEKNNFWGGYSEAEEVDLEIPHWAFQPEAA